MILDGNTDWSPDDVDEAVDPGMTVGIGPLPQRAPGDPAGPGPAPIVDPPDGDGRPPMVAAPLPTDADPDLAPYGWIASGPSRDGVTVVDRPSPKPEPGETQDPVPSAADPSGFAGDESPSMPSLPTGHPSAAPHLTGPFPGGAGPGPSLTIADLPADTRGTDTPGTDATGSGPGADPDIDGDAAGRPTGPLRAEVAAVELLPSGSPPADPGTTGPLPTGPVPITVSSRAPSAAPAPRVVLQAAAVLLAAGLVGLVVYGALRSAAGDGGATELPTPDRDDGVAIDPGPGDPGGNEDAIGSKRGTAGLGQRVEGDDGAGSTDDAGAGGPDADGTPPATASSSADPDRSSGPDDPQDEDPFDPAGPTTVADRSAPPTTIDGRIDLPITSVGGSTPSSPSATGITTGPVRSTTVVTSPPTTGASTSTPTTAASSTSPTTAPTSTTPASTLPANLIVAPVAGSVANWGSRLSLRANPVPGATSYCWELSGTGGEFTRCRSKVSYRHDANHPTPGSGPVTIVASARSADGEVIMRRQITITLLARSFVGEPNAGDRLSPDDRLQLQAVRPPRADRYCWTVAQGSTTTGPICVTGRRLNLSRSALSDFELGPVTVQATAELGGVVIGRQLVNFRFTDD